MAATKCTHCGAGDKPSSLLKCPCGVAHYCDKSCQVANRRIHKTLCRRILGGDADCPICAACLPFDSDRVSWMTCCGAVLCASCSEAHEATWARALPFDARLRHLCGLPTPDGGMRCPFCRAPEAETPEEEMRRVLERKEKGDLNAYEQLAVQYLPPASDYAPLDIDKAFELLLYAAERGNVGSQFRLGTAYTLGRPHYGCEPNSTKAFEWFQRAAKQGDMMACHNLGCRYGNGEGVRQSWAKAKFWFERGAALGDPSSVDHLRMMRQKGRSEGDVSVSAEDVAVAMRAFLAATTELDAKARAARNRLRINHPSGSCVSQDGAPLL